MSTNTRDAVTSRLQFNNDIARDDLQEQRANGTYKVHTNTVAMLDHLTRNSPHKILVTALCDDHGNSRPGDPWSHTGGGCADIWHAEWEKLGDSEILTVLKNVARNPWCRKIGLGGYARTMWGRFTPAPWQTIFDDNDQDHVHLETGPDAPYNR